MAELLLASKRRLSGGFTMIETMIAMFIFAVGVLSLAALMTTVNLNTDRSRYTGAATLLATEKLEDLNRYPALSSDSSVTVGGDLGSDKSGYYDDVQVQSDNGQITEITYNPDVSTGACYDVFTHSMGTKTPAVDPSAADNCPTTKPTALPDALNFHRRWLVENPITLPSGTSVAVRRVTVWVSLWAPDTNKATTFQGQPITFQLSTVRP